MRHAGDVEQAAFAIENFIQFRLFRRALDAGLRRDHFLISGYYGNGPECQALRQIHRADHAATVWYVLAFMHRYPVCASQNPCQSYRMSGEGAGCADVGSPDDLFKIVL